MGTQYTDDGPLWDKTFFEKTTFKEITIQNIVWLQKAVKLLG